MYTMAKSLVDFFGVGISLSSRKSFRLQAIQTQVLLLQKKLCKGKLITVQARRGP